MIPGLRRRAEKPVRALPEEKPVLMDRLEGRIYFAHFGHEVFLPEVASNGSSGLEAAISAPGDHRRGRLIVST